MIFKKLTEGELGSTRHKWENDLDALEVEDELIRPSMYWSALDAASARISGELESLQYGIYIDDSSDSAVALVAVHPVAHQTPPYLKVREIRLEPLLDYDVGRDADDYLIRHAKITRVIATIISDVLSLATRDFQMSKVKIYGSTKVEFEMFSNFVLHAEGLQEAWGVKASVHGNWLQFEKI